MPAKHRYLGSSVLLLVPVVSGQVVQPGAGSVGIADTLVEGLDAVTFYSITDIYGASIFLAVLGVVFFAELNILEQVFLQLEERVRSDTDSSSLLYTDDESDYPTGTTGFSFVTAYILVNSLLGVFGFYAAVSIGLLSLLTILVMHRSVFNAARGTDISAAQSGGRSNPVEVRGSDGGSSRQRRNSSSLSSSQVRRILRVLNRTESQIESVQEIEEDEIRAAREFLDEFESHFSSIKKKIDSSVDQPLKDTLVSLGLAPDDVKEMLEEPGSHADRLGGIDLEGDNRARVWNVYQKLEELEQELENQVEATYEELEKVDEVRKENEDVIEALGRQAEKIQDAAGMELESALKEFRRPANLENAGLRSRQEKKEARQLAKRFKNSWETVYAVEKAARKIEEVLEEDEIEEETEIEALLERREEAVELLLKEVEGNRENGQRTGSSGETVMVGVPDWERENFETDSLEVRVERDTDGESIMRFYYRAAEVLKQEGVFSGRLDYFPDVLKADLPFTREIEGTARPEAVRFEEQNQEYQVARSPGLTQSHDRDNEPLEKPRVIIDESLDSDKPLKMAVLCHEMMHVCFEPVGSFTHREIHRKCMSFLIDLIQDLETIEAHLDASDHPDYIRRESLIQAYGNAAASEQLFPDR